MTVLLGRFSKFITHNWFKHLFQSRFTQIIIESYTCYINEIKIWRLLLLSNKIMPAWLIFFYQNKEIFYDANDTAISNSISVLTF